MPSHPLKAIATRAVLAWLVHLVLTMIDPTGPHGHLVIAVCVFFASGFVGTERKKAGSERQKG